jgi:hypothetical protein
MAGLRAAAVAAILLTMAWMMPIAVESGADQQQASGCCGPVRAAPTPFPLLSLALVLTAPCCCRSILPTRRAC